VVVSNSVNSVTSQVAVLTVNPIVVSITITNPPDGAMFTAPASFALAASVSPVAVVTNVTFYGNDTLLGSLSSPPFGFIVNNLGAGAYTFSAVALANNGSAATYAPVTITVQGTPPPPGPAVITVIATDPAASEVGPDPGAFQVTRTGDTNDPLTVYYLLGGTAINGQDYLELSNSITIAAGSVSADITVTPIDDGDSSQEVSDTVILQLTGAPDGQPGYEIGSPSNAVVTITESTAPQNPPPVVRIVYPRNGSRYVGGANVVLVAQATDPDGSVTNVQFFAGTQLLGTATLAPREREDGEDDHEDGEDHTPRDLYVLVWRNVTVGRYTITAVATDNLGATTTSDPITITVARHRRLGERDR
jgi:hypothetical protein